MQSPNESPQSKLTPGDIDLIKQISQDATRSLNQAYQEFVDLILSVPDSLFLSPMDGWSPRDVVAHLIGWNGHMIEASASILRGEPPTYYADAPNDYSNINAGFVAMHSSRVKSDLLRDLESTMDGFEAFVQALDPGELIADHGVSHYSGRPATVRGIIASLTGDYQSHTRQISEWLQTK
jgi:hypothetical protein